MSAKALRDQIRDRLAEISSQALRAQRLSVKNDNLCDALDDIDNELQKVIELVNTVRREEAR